MSGELALAGKVIALVGTGSQSDRAIAIACAEAGADLALGTEGNDREQEYAMNSIANEIWAIGREHFVRVLESPAGVEDLVAEARERLGRCDAVVTRKGLGAGLDVPLVTKTSDTARTLEDLRHAALP